MEPQLGTFQATELVPLLHHRCYAKPNRTTVTNISMNSGITLQPSENPSSWRASEPASWSRKGAVRFILIHHTIAIPPMSRNATLRNRPR